MSSDIATPNDTVFSIAAKTYLCSGVLLPNGGGMYFGYPTPQGTKADFRTLTKGIVASTVHELERTGFIRLGQTTFKALIGSSPALTVSAVYSGAPGFSGRFLEATQWVETDLITLLGRLFPRDQAPMIPFLDDISLEFVEAGILARGGYGAHKNAWNADWLAYLQGAWHPEVYEIWTAAHARPDFPLIERNVMHAVAGSQHTERDMWDD